MIVVLASVVDPSVVLGSPSGSAPTTTAGGAPLGAAIFTAAHLLAYGVLAWFLVGGLGGAFKTDRATTVRIVLASVVLAWTVGFGVELLQAPLAARTASVTDALVNGLGAIAGAGSGRWFGDRAQQGNEQPTGRAVFTRRARIPSRYRMSVTTLHRPAHRDALSLLETAFEEGRMVTAFGRCTVEYDGRASSSLGPGDRLVVCKPDGTVLVHTDESREPVNWQPPGCTHYASLRDGRLRIRSERSAPSERLDVDFRRLEQVTAYEVADRSDLTLTGSEEDLRTRILDDPELIEPGFDPVATERETAAGPVDVFGADAEGRPVVVELKRRRVGPSAASQLRRYVEAVDEEFPDEGVRGILVAPSVTDRAAALLDELRLEFVPLEPVGEGEPTDERDREHADTDAKRGVDGADQ